MLGIRSSRRISLMFLSSWFFYSYLRLPFPSSQEVQSENDFIIPGIRVYKLAWTLLDPHINYTVNIQ